MNPGDCFIGDPTGGVNRHLYLVVAAPKQGRLAIVNFTTAKNGPHSFGVPAGYHPWLTHQSELNFADALIVGEVELLNRIAAGEFQPQSPMSAAKLAMIQMQAKASPGIPKNVKALLP